MARISSTTRLPHIAIAVSVIATALAATTARGQDIQPGRIVDDVPCKDARGQSYALYVPSGYTPDRVWSLLLAFHPGARGRLIVETYRDAAERYGYIVAGSNTSRNGSWESSTGAVRCMSRDVAQRFAIDAERLYTTGHSGGARVAMQVGLEARNPIAGVIASSAGFPDVRPRTKVPFAVFATVGTEDFNYVEMQMVDRTLTTPHRLAVFDGGHTLPPPSVAMEAIEWLELQAMKSGRRERDDVLVRVLLAKARHRVLDAADPLSRALALEAILADFTGLAAGLSGDEAEVRRLADDEDVKKVRARARADVDAEARALDEALRVEARLADSDRRPESLRWLQVQLAEWADAAQAAENSPARQRARRLLASLSASARERSKDRDYHALLDRYAPRRQGPR